ncbi:hypothetical protein ITX54_11465 [Rouxiella silvae]|uniref:Uncharacterized protein n=1 Tax=Rouxiella silvae TaxID=1646373 RepID=A0AA41BX62_9GAMM|nr:hypothetical protein [Rouxiella silvae]MBF6637273.1 hypothetical protein [Rouxiella silvae]
MIPVGTPKPELSPLQLFSKLTTYSASESKDIIRSLNGMFAEKNKTPGDVLIKIIETLIRGASHASHFEALLLAIDNGLRKNDPDVVNLFKRLAEGIEQKLSKIDSRHKLPFLSTFLPHESTLAPKEYPELRKVIHKQKGELTQIYKVREAKRQALQQMAQQLNPSCLEWNISPFKFDYKRGIHIKTYHLKDTQGRTFEATLLQPEKPMSDVDVRAIVDTTQGLYPGNDEVIVEQKVLLPTDGGHRSAIITLFELSHLKTFGEWRTQENQKMNQSFDGVVGAYINKKTMVTDILNELQVLYRKMSEITALKGKGYSYLNFENIYIVKGYSSASICFNPAPSICSNPAPIVYQQLYLKEYSNNSGNAHTHVTGDSMTANGYIASEVRNNLPKIKSDIYSMGAIWENIFVVDVNGNNCPYLKTIGDTMDNRISRRSTIF